MRFGDSLHVMGLKTLTLQKFKYSFIYRVWVCGGAYWRLSTLLKFKVELSHPINRDRFAFHCVFLPMCANKDGQKAFPSEYSSQVLSAEMLPNRMSTHRVWHPEQTVARTSDWNRCRLPPPPTAPLSSFLPHVLECVEFFYSHSTSSNSYLKLPITNWLCRCMCLLRLLEYENPLPHSWHL